ncbi:uncharacterized protein BXZ73DRAFT_98517 [Epithele typhae]|uniref:uncharacterized protein n=1 Tax=Epithele typhae TaxID=378194 RepID=UPI0020087CEF|nr:uncharacterized protein BXZ73DRAFT_98517 [Epithele typhae]KAH9941301.1 hypothetical protein BXZ73DRAFT_98517 [Epithele typhae]
MNPTLSVLLLRDGTLYFLLLLALNVAQMIISSIPNGTTSVSHIVSPITSILITRFLLNLRQVAETLPDSDRPSGALPTPIFSTIFHSEDILENIGAPLRSGIDAADVMTLDSSDGSAELQHVHSPWLIGLTAVGSDTRVARMHTHASYPDAERLSLQPSRSVRSTNIGEELELEEIV